MIIIERNYDVSNPSGGRALHNVTRKAFLDDDLDGVQAFLNERSNVSGYEWHNLDFRYIKL